MTLKDLWMLYEADKRILGFSTTHTIQRREIRRTESSVSYYICTKYYAGF